MDTGLQSTFELLIQNLPNSVNFCITWHGPFWRLGFTILSAFWLFLVTFQSVSDLIVDRWPWMFLTESAVSFFDPWQTQRSAVFVLLLLWLIVSCLQSVFPSFLLSLFSDIEWMRFCLSISNFVIVTYDRVSQTWLSLPDPSVSGFPLV